VVSGGRDSASGKYSAWVWAAAPTGKPYPSVNEKTIDLGVSENLPALGGSLPPKRSTGKERVLYHRRIRIIAGYLGWECTWSGDTNVVIHLYDYGENDPVAARAHGLSLRWDKKISLCLNANEDRFAECPRQPNEVR
jgi:hypothetical protein